MNGAGLAKAATRAAEKLLQGEWGFLRHPFRGCRDFLDGEKVKREPYGEEVLSEFLARWPRVESDPAIQEHACVASAGEAVGGISEDQARCFISDLTASGLQRHVADRLARLRATMGPQQNSGALSHNPHGGLFLYLLVRARKPWVVLETGVANGESTSFFLQALEDNRVGRLYSIDLPPEGARPGRQYCVPGDLGVGWLVPDRLRGRWDLIVGPAQVELPKLLQRLGSISMFFHDSLHTYYHMMWEYETSWPFIEPSGLLVSDDINCAWSHFCKGRRGQPVSYFRLGAMRKE